MAQRDVVAGVIQLSNLLTRRLGPVFEKAHVTPQQWAILSTLAESNEPLTLAGVARVMLVSKQNMTGMIARLEQVGLAERHDDPSDLRSSRLALTRRGRATVEKLRPLYEAWRAEMMAEVSERDAAVLERTIERLIATLQDE
jgi:Transcriptional regulators